jgi:hypothetical protein
MPLTLLLLLLHARSFAAAAASVAAAAADVGTWWSRVHWWLRSMVECSKHTAAAAAVRQTSHWRQR